MTFGRIIYVKHDCKRRELVINQRLKKLQKSNKDVIQGPFLLFVKHVSNIIQSQH